MKYADPYVSGVFLGLVLLAAFTFAGRGLGASGAFGATASGTVAAVAPRYAADNPYFARYLGRPGGPWREWLLLEIAGVVIGGFLSALVARRLQFSVERGPRIAIGCTCERCCFVFEIEGSRDRLMPCKFMLRAKRAPAFATRNALGKQWPARSEISMAWFSKSDWYECAIHFRSARWGSVVKCRPGGRWCAEQGA